MNLKHMMLTSFFSFMLVTPAMADNHDMQKNIRLYTLDCGKIKVLDKNIFDTTDSYEGALELKASCYVIQHGDQYMLWDAGFNPDAIKGVKKTDMFQLSINETLPESLAKIGLKPKDVDIIGISHVHFDHIGQANLFKDAKLYVGSEDFDLIFDPGADKSMYVSDFINEWQDGENVVKVTEKTDVFGDGSVMILPSHGHTPGHTSLLVNLENAGPQILVGDLWHFRDNMDENRMPDFNTDMQDTKKSMDMVKAMANEKNARLIIQHDPHHFHQMPKNPAYLD